MKKKILSLFLSTVIIVTMLSSMLTASASDNYYGISFNPTPATVGSTVTVVVYLNITNYYWDSLQFNVNFNNSFLQYQGYSTVAGPAFSSSKFSNSTTVTDYSSSGRLSFITNGIDFRSYKGEVYYINFKILSSSIEGYPVTLTDGIMIDKDGGITSTTYYKNVGASIAVKSTSDANLSDLKVNGSTVTGFASGTSVYNVVLPYGTTTVPTVTATTYNESATAGVNPATGLPGSTTVLVTSQDGTTTKTYTVNFLIAKNTDARLSDLKVNGTSVVGFDSNTNTYSLVLPTGTTAVPTVTATAVDTNSSIKVTPATGLPGSTTVSVTAEDGITTKTYTLNFTVAKSTDATLAELKVNGASISDFSSETTTYNVVLPAGTKTVPTVTATTVDSKSSITVTPATGLPGSTTVVVKAEDGTTTKTYTVNFTREKSTDATLSDLRVFGNVVSGFAPDITTYNVKLPCWYTEVPTVSATATDSSGATVSITQATSTTGFATVQVVAENGTINSYTVNFSLAPEPTISFKNGSLFWFTKVNDGEYTYDLIRYGSNKFVTASEFVSEMDIKYGFIEVYDNSGNILISTSPGSTFTSSTVIVSTGMYVALCDEISGWTSRGYTLVMKGDLNGDGTMEGSDSSIIKQIVAGTYSPQYYEKAAADTNGDGFVLGTDAILFNRSIAVPATATIVQTK